MGVEVLEFQIIDENSRSSSVSLNITTEPDVVSYTMKILGSWDNPTLLDEMLEAMGATVVDYDEKYLCCGYGVTNAADKPAEDLDARKFKSMIKAGAEYLCVSCPSCFLQLEGVQRTLKKEYQLDVNVPILYFTEFLALALGISPDEIGMKFHSVKPKTLMEQFK